MFLIGKIRFFSGRFRGPRFLHTFVSFFHTNDRGFGGLSAVSASITRIISSIIDPFYENKHKHNRSFSRFYGNL